jgi:hypothetical protein
MNTKSFLKIKSDQIAAKALKNQTVMSIALIPEDQGILGTIASR